MFELYIPKKFCREFVEVKGSSQQLTSIMATVKGIKPCMDDWIKTDRYNAYRKICKKYGLFIAPDTVFKMVTKISVAGRIAGGERLTTTVALGFPFDKLGKYKNTLVHVFIAKLKKNLENAFKNGWYPLIINNRVIDKPLIDAFKFGYDLGYPRCCVDFFHNYNNWYRYSYLYEAFKNTPKNDYPYLCNPFLRLATYTYALHMPCSYNCPSTSELAGKIRAAIDAEEPEFSKKIDRYLKMPLLVFYENKAYAFRGEIKGSRLCYKNSYFISTMPEYNSYGADLKQGDCLFLENRDVVVLKKGKLIKRIKWHQKSFAPETPFIIQFQ
ncbi:MAG: hypothetical protein QME65_05090 [Candidatus Omnitrophota bacterium]|nr:hypothetical protein [Candidatus Omnitrophota bacterium]